MRKWINGGLISAKLGRGTPQGHRADGDRGQNTLCSPAAGVGDRERLGEAAGGAARTWVYSSPLGLHRPVYKVGGGSGVRTTAQKGEMHLAGLAQSSSGPQAGSCPPLRDQMAGQHPPAPWHWDHTPSHPLSARKGHIGAALGQNHLKDTLARRPCPGGMTSDHFINLDPLCGTALWLLPWRCWSGGLTQSHLDSLPEYSL